MEKKKFLDEKGVEALIDCMNLKKIVLNVGDVTLNAYGYLNMSWSDYGLPDGYEVECATVSNWGYTSPIGAFNVGYRHVFGQANMKISNLSVILLVRKKDV